MSDAPVTSAVPTPAAPTTPAPGATTTPAADAVTAAPPAPPPQKIKLAGKIDGQEISEELTHEQLLAQWQKMKAADRRLAEAAEMRKVDAAKKAKLKEDPWSALKEDGIDLRELAIQRLAEEFRQEQLKQQDPKEFEKLQLQKELEAERARVKRFEDEQQAAKQQQELEQTRAEIMETYGQALQKTGLPITEETAARMIEIGIVNLENGLDLTPEQLAAETKAYFEGLETKASERIKNRFTTLKGEDLLKDLGDDVVKEVQRTLLARARASIARPPPPLQKVEAPKNDGRREYVSEHELKRQLGVGITPMTRDVAER